MGSHPSGGEPGGEMRKFLVDSGGARWLFGLGGGVGGRGKRRRRRLGVSLCLKYAILGSFGSFRACSWRNGKCHEKGRMAL